MTNKTIGKYGETLAKDFLIKKGYKILEMNYHYSKMAEIDIIALKDNIIHFVEVKTRTSLFFGTPLEAISPKKLSSIYMAAKSYLQTLNMKYKKFQIDAIGIVLDKNDIKDIVFLENISI